MAWQISYDASLGIIPFDGSTYAYTTVQTTAGTFREGTHSFRVNKYTLTTPGYFQAPFVTATDTPALSVWLYLTQNYFIQDADVRHCEIRFVTTSGHSVSARWNRANLTFDIYVGDDLVASGSENAITDVGLFNLRFYGTINDTAGSLEVNINGNVIATYSGNTLPEDSDTDVEYVEFWGRGAAGSSDPLFYVSCISLNDGGADPGDRRVYVKFPTSDVSVQWSRSTGTSNWAILDNVPPTTAYVYTQTDGHTDKLGLGDIPEIHAVHGVAKFIYALKTTADPQTILNGVDSNSTIDYTENEIGTTPKYHYHLMTEDPDTSAPFDRDGVNALLTYREANI